jgi:hypothetical protein
LNVQRVSLLDGWIQANAGCVEHALDMAPLCLNGKSALYPRPKRRGFTA